jgi:hypothetical protein
LLNGLGRTDNNWIYGGIIMKKSRLLGALAASFLLVSGAQGVAYVMVKVQQQPACQLFKSLMMAIRPVTAFIGLILTEMGVALPFKHTLI